MISSFLTSTDFLRSSSQSLERTVYGSLLPTHSIWSSWIYCSRIPCIYRIGLKSVCITDCLCLTSSRAIMTIPRASISFSSIYFWILFITRLIQATLISRLIWTLFKSSSEKAAFQMSICLRSPCLTFEVLRIKALSFTFLPSIWIFSCSLSAKDLTSFSIKENSSNFFSKSINCGSDSLNV